LVYNKVPIFFVIAEKSLDASHFASSSVSFSASSAPATACRLLCRALSSSSSSYLSPHTPLLFCSRPPLPFLPSSTSSNRATRCHGCRRPCSPWAAIISPSLLSSTPCRASPLPTGAPRPHPSANPSLDRPTDVHRRPSSATASASPSTRPSSSSYPSPITPTGPRHLEEAPGPPHRASLTPACRNITTVTKPDRHRPSSSHPGFNRANPKVALVSLMLPRLSLLCLNPWIKYCNFCVMIMR
jgi:hypothetical protein